MLSSGDPSLHETDDNRQHNLLQSSFYDMFLLARVDAYEKSIQINAKRVEGNLFTTKIMPDKVYSINVFTDTLPGETFFEKFEEQLTLEKQMEESKVEEEKKDKALNELKDKLEALDGDESEVEKKKLELEVKQAELAALELNEKTRKVRERLEQLRTELFEVEEPDLEENIDDEEMVVEVPAEGTEKPEADPPELEETTGEETTEKTAEEGEPVVEEMDAEGEEKATEEEKGDTPAEETPEDPPAAPVTVDIVVAEEDVPEEDVPEEDVPEEDVPEEDAPEEDAPTEDENPEVISEEAAPQEDAPPEDVEMENTEDPAVEAEAEKEKMETEEEKPKEGGDEAVIDLTEDVEETDPEKTVCRILIGLKEPLGEVRTSLQGCKDATPKTYVILLEADLPEGQRFNKVKKFLEGFMKGSYEEDQVNKIKWGKKVKTANVAAKLLKEAMKRRRIDFEMVSCPNECGVTLKAYEMLDHEKRECKNRQVECRYCKLAMKHCELAEHKTTCQLCILRCVNNCGKSIARKDMECHLATTCLNQKIDCEFAAFGCKQKEKRKNKVHHLNQKSVQHLNLVRKAHEKLQNKYDKLLDFLKEKFDDVPEFEEPESEPEDKKVVENEPQCIVIED